MMAKASVLRLSHLDSLLLGFQRYQIAANLCQEKRPTQSREPYNGIELDY
jgi:hypothetical protein